MIHKKYLLILILLLGVISCDRYNNRCTPYPPPVHKKSYIQGFFDFEQIQTSRSKGVTTNGNDLNFGDMYLDPEKYHSVTEGVGYDISLISEFLGRGRVGSAEYKEYIKAIGDTAHHKNESSPYDIIIFALTDTLSSVDITCTKDYDTEHPAGSSLSDIFSVYFDHPYATIKNGYKSFNGENYYTALEKYKYYPSYQYSIFGSTLSEVDWGTKYFIGPIWSLILKKAPTEKGEYSFIISITNSQGKNIVQEVEPIKLLGANN